MILMCYLKISSVCSQAYAGCFGVGKTFLGFIYINITKNTLHPQLSGYGDTDARNMWSSLGSTYCICLMWCIICTLHRPVLKPIPKARYAEVHVLCNVLGMLRLIFMKLVQVLYIFMTLTHMWTTGVNITGTTYSS